MGLLHDMFYKSSQNFHDGEVYMGEFTPPPGRCALFSMASFWILSPTAGNISIRVEVFRDGTTLYESHTFTNPKATSGSPPGQRFQPPDTIFLPPSGKCKFYFHSSDANDDTADRLAYLYLFDPTGSEFLDTETLIDGKTIAEALKIISAVVAGKVSGAGTGTETFLGLDGTTERVEVEVDAEGNRTALTYS